jgi:multidrug efflux pump subunit AcrA (membrane-fusion protein)
LRPGQTIEATVTLPNVPAGEAVVPAAALIEEEGVFFLFVQPDPTRSVYCQRRVIVVRRAGEVAHVRTHPTLAETRRSWQAVRPGERVVTSGAAELRAALVDRQTPP